MPRLRRSDLNRPGWTRRPHRDTFTIVTSNGEPVHDPEELARVEQLVIPPAWVDVWISPYPNGHIQAVGTDAAGRRQYLYHPQWQAKRARLKHDHVLQIAERLPAARRRVARELAGPGMPKERALALAYRLLDRGMFRIGQERYAEANGSYGLATIQREHVQIDGALVLFDYEAKSHQRRLIGITDKRSAAALTTLLERDDPAGELLAWQDGENWHTISSRDISDYVKQLLGAEASAKDLRTWRATVLAAIALSATTTRPSQRSRAKAVTEAITQVAAYLGNTPAVCRSSYVDPRIVDLFEAGVTIADAVRASGLPPVSEPLIAPKPRPSTEKAVLDLLRP